MGLTKPISVTEKKTAANRQNAQRSTGPRTEAGKERSSLNALCHGIYSNLRTRVAMIELGEDPDEFDELVDRLKRCWGCGQDPLIDVEVEELAWLLWRKQRLERARDARLVDAKQRADAEGRRRAREFIRDTVDVEEATRIGLRRLKDSPAAFEETLGVLRLLREDCEGRKFSSDHAEHVRYLYGTETTENGVTIKGLFEQLADPQALEGEDPEELRQMLLHYIDYETREVEAQYALFRRDHIELTMWARGSRLAPAEDWQWMIREANSLDRAIDRKVKLLMGLRKDLRQHRKWEREQLQWEQEQEAAGAGNSAPALRPGDARGGSSPVGVEDDAPASVSTEPWDAPIAPSGRENAELEAEPEVEDDAPQAGVETAASEVSSEPSAAEAAAPGVLPPKAPRHAGPGARPEAEPDSETGEEVEQAS